MNLEFKIKSLPEYDRYVFYVVKNNKITHIDFKQGIDVDYEGDIISTFLEGVNDKNPIIDIYNNLINQAHYLENNFQSFNELHKVNYAIELYSIAYIYQIIKY
jgi:hypothetical protein